MSPENQEQFAELLQKVRISAGGRGGRAHRDNPTVSAFDNACSGCLPAAGSMPPWGCEGKNLAPLSCQEQGGRHEPRNQDICGRILFPQFYRSAAQRTCRSRGTAPGYLQPDGPAGNLPAAGRAEGSAGQGGAGHRPSPREDRRHSSVFRVRQRRGCSNG